MRKYVKVLLAFSVFMVIAILFLNSTKRIRVGDYNLYCDGFNYAEIYHYFGNDKEVYVPKRILFWRIKVVGSQCFSNNKGIEYVYIPDTIERVEHEAFDDCVSLKKIYFEPSIKLEYIPAEMCDGCTNLEEVNLPQGIEEIGEYAFRDCRTLSEITLVDGITEINQHAFENCTSLSEIVFPETVRYVSVYAFSGCSNLEYVEFKGTESRVGMYAFDGTKWLANQESSN